MDTWDLAALYPDIESFQKDKSSFMDEAAQVAKFKGLLGRSAKDLKAALVFYWAQELRLRRIESYAGRLSDQDVRDSKNKALLSEVEQIRVRLAELSSFFDPEIIALPGRDLEGFFAEEPGLRIYERSIREAIRRRKHILSHPEERILAAAYDIAAAGGSLYRVFANADLPRETIELADGAKIKLTDANWVKYRQSPVKADRDKLSEAFFRQFERFSRSIGEMLFSQLKTHNFYATMRGYPSTLHAALDHDDIDTAIYTNLIETAHRNLATFHRYLRLKTRSLGLPRLDYQDVYAPFTRDVKIEVPYELSKSMILDSAAPMGPEYVKALSKAFTDRWIDVYPREGKQSGAYMSGRAYGVHPYVLMNYNGDFHDALTLAHELGHAMHSFHSNASQPLPTSDYSIFVAEVASTFNENLLNDFMVRKTAGAEERLYLLGEFLDGTIKGTFYRQVQLAEFELLVHRAVESGEALTGEALSKMYLDLVRRYYGHDEGVCRVPDVFAAEWAYIPHFYYNYYVFQYSTSVAAANALSQKVLDGEPGALERYFGLLKAGDSKSPVAILADAGVDMTKPEAYDALIARANRCMDEMEKILAKKES